MNPSFILKMHLKFYICALFVVSYVSDVGRSLKNLVGVDVIASTTCNKTTVTMVTS